MLSNISERRPQRGEFFRVGRIEPTVETISNAELLQYLKVIDQHTDTTHTYPTVYEIMVWLKKSDLRQTEQVMHQLVKNNYVRIEIIRGTPVYILTEEGRKLLKK